MTNASCGILTKNIESGISKVKDISYSLKYKNNEVDFKYPYKGLVLESKDGKLESLDPVLAYILDSEEEELKEGKEYEIPGWILFGEYDENKVVVVRVGKEAKNINIGDIIPINGQYGIVKHKTGNVVYVDLNHPFCDKILTVKIEKINEISKNCVKEIFTKVVENVDLPKPKFKKEVVELEVEYNKLKPSNLEILLGLFPIFKSELKQLKLTINNESEKKEESEKSEKSKEENKKPTKRNKKD